MIYTRKKERKTERTFLSVGELHLLLICISNPLQHAKPNKIIIVRKEKTRLCLLASPRNTSAGPNAVVLLATKPDLLLSCVVMVVVTEKIAIEDADCAPNPLRVSMPKSAPCLLSGIVSVVWVKRVDVFEPASRTDADLARNRRVLESVMVGPSGIRVWPFIMY